MFQLIYSYHQTDHENKEEMFTDAWDLYKYNVT
jgi:hypothetical protein